MGRSLKKGPFVNAKLLRTIEEMNAANDKKVVKTWSQIGRICSYQNLQRPCRR